MSAARANTKRSVGVSITASCYDGHAGGGACARAWERNARQSVERARARGAAKRQAKHPARASARRARAKPAPGASCRDRPHPPHPTLPQVGRRGARALLGDALARLIQSVQTWTHHTHTVNKESQSAVIGSKFIGERDEHDQAARQWPYFDARHCCTVNVTYYVYVQYI